MRDSLLEPRPRAAVVAIALLVLAFPALARVERQLSFEERVMAQEAIERVYYTHQTGTTIPFEEAVSRALLEQKVHTYLRESSALEEFWGATISADALRGELERIAAQTRMPETLSDLYGALENDAFLVQECLARPALVHRMARNYFAFDPRAHASQLKQAQAIRSQLESGLIDPMAPDARRWTVTTTESGPREAALEVGPVRQERDAYVVSVTRADGLGGILTATYGIEKTAWDVWWADKQANLGEAPVEPVAASVVSLPLPSAHEVDPELDEPVLDAETAALALDAVSDADGDGYTSDVDCDDTRATIYPGAPQVCDELNDDCADPAWPTVPEIEIDNHLYPDADGDGAGSLCDCNDGAAGVHPGASEVCDGLDNDCDGVTDLDTPGLNTFCDTHQPGVCATGVSLCTNGVLECHRISTPSPERCDHLDTDCDGQLAWFEKDEDGDGWPVGGYWESGCPMICIDPFHRHCTGDCNDHNPSVYPYAPEICGDGLINDCVLALRQIPGQGMCVYYSWNEGDCDHDGWTQCHGDCGPLDPTIYPGAADICDGKDNNCNGYSEEADYDHDGYAVCRGDCDDHSPSIRPGLSEACDGADNNCDGVVDNAITPIPSVCGVGTCAAIGQKTCQGGQLIDSCVAGAPSAEICDGLDNDCNGAVDENDIDLDGFKGCAGDCDDTNAAIHPGAIDVPGDPWDQDCTGGATCDPAASWSGHGAYVACVDNECANLKKAGLLTGKQCDAIVTEAARSQWGGP